MPRRNLPRETYEPLDLTPESIVIGPQTRRRPGDQVNRPPPLTWRERERREHEQQERQTNARVNRGIDWSICLVTGCGRDLTRQSERVHPEGSRDHTLELPLCFVHLGVAAKQAAWRKDDPLLVTAVADVIERREARAQTRREAAKKAWLTVTDGWIYYVRLNGLIKVGWTRDIDDRIRSYGPSVEVLVAYQGTRDDETNLHRQLKPARARGHEWYDDGPILADFIAKAIEQHGPPTQNFDTWSKPKQIVAGKRVNRSA